MAEHCGYVVKVENLRKHSNADRLQIATFFDNDTIVSLETQIGDIGVYFPSDLQLSQEYCEENNLLRSKDPNVKGGYLDPDKRNIRVMKLRGEKSDGLYMPLSTLAKFTDIAELHVGDTITVLNGHEICRKYIPRTNQPSVRQGDKHPKKRVAAQAPTFYEHADTEQLNFNLDKFKTGDIVELTLKMHGTSQRTGYLPVTREIPNGFFRRLFHKPPRTKTEYEYIDGTRRVVLFGDNKGGFYDDDGWRHDMGKRFVGKLKHGETVYYEVVGFQGLHGRPIMASCDNSKIKDKEFSKMYGPQTVFSYGCDPDGVYDDEHPCCDIYVYRMTMVNEDGDIAEYPPWEMRRRCEQIGVKTVIPFERFIIPWDVDPGEYVKEKAEQYFDGPDPVGKSHVREGVVARIVNRPTFTAYKTKNWSFKVLENIVKDEAAAPDLEEAQEAEANE